MEKTLGELAAAIDAELRGDASHTVSGCAGLSDASENEVSFFIKSRYLSDLRSTGAGAVILGDAHVEAAGERNLLVAEDPYFAFRQAVVALHGFRQQPTPGISPLAQVHSSARLGADCAVLPFAYIDEAAEIGERTTIYPGCFVGARTRIGSDSILYPSVTVYDDCVVGDRVILHAGTSVGQDGFGHATHAGAHHKIPQVGVTIVADDVEMGANCAIDRATVGATEVGAGSKFSNLVVIGHGTKVGRHNLLVAQVGIAGSATLGDYVVIGGQSGTSGHIDVGDGTQIAAKSALFESTEKGARVFGTPAKDFFLAKKASLLHYRLPDMVREMRSLRRRVAELEKRLGEPE